MSTGRSSVDRREGSEYVTVVRLPQPPQLQEKEASGNEQSRGGGKKVQLAIACEKEYTCWVLT